MPLGTSAVLPAQQLFKFKFKCIAIQLSSFEMTLNYSSNTSYDLVHFYTTTLRLHARRERGLYIQPPYYHSEQRMHKRIIINSSKVLIKTIQLLIQLYTQLLLSTNLETQFSVVAKDISHRSPPGRQPGHVCDICGRCMYAPADHSVDYTQVPVNNLIWITVT